MSIQLSLRPTIIIKMPITSCHMLFKYDFSRNSKRKSKIFKCVEHYMECKSIPDTFAHVDGTRLQLLSFSCMF